MVQTSKSSSPSKQQLRERNRSSDFVRLYGSSGGPDYEQISWSARCATFSALLELGERCALAGETETALNSLAEAALLEDDWMLKTTLEHPVLITAAADYASMSSNVFQECAERATPKRLVRALRQLADRQGDIRFAVIEQFTDVVAYQASRSLARAAALADDGAASRAARGVAVAIARSASRRATRAVKAGGDPRFQSYLLGAAARIADDGEGTANVLRSALGIDATFLETSGRRLRLAILDASLSLWPAHRSARVARVDLARSVKLALDDLDVLIGTNDDRAESDDDPRMMLWRAKRRWLKGEDPNCAGGETEGFDDDDPALLAKAGLQKEVRQWSDALAKELALARVASETGRSRKKEAVRTSRQAEQEASRPPPAAFDESCCVGQFISPDSVAARIASAQEELRRARDLCVARKM